MHHGKMMISSNASALCWHLAENSGEEKKTDKSKCGTIKNTGLFDTGALKYLYLCTDIKDRLRI